MKKVCILFLLVILSFLLIACEESGGEGGGGTVTIAIISDVIGTPGNDAVTALLMVSGDDPETADIPLAVGSGVVPALTNVLTITLKAADASGNATASTWKSEEDTAYDLYIYLDIGNNGTLDTGTDVSKAAYYPYQYSSINSDTTQNITVEDINGLTVSNY